jgi:hypothetical protein
MTAGDFSALAICLMGTAKGIVEKEPGLQTTASSNAMLEMARPSRF